MSIDNIVDNIFSYPTESKVIVIAPIIRKEKGTFLKLLDELLKEGFSRVEIDGEIKDCVDDGCRLIRNAEFRA